MANHKPRKRFALCIRNGRYPTSLDVRKLYELLPDPQAARRGLARVVDESGEDYLYPKEYFVEIKIPAAAVKALA